MKIRTVEVCEGERLGDIDWSYDFMKHKCLKSERLERCKLFIRQVEEAFQQKKTVKVTLSHSCLMDEVVDVGMYDGWPHWKPVPSVATRNFLGVSWHSFYSIEYVHVSEPSHATIMGLDQAADRPGLSLAE